MAKILLHNAQLRHHHSRRHLVNGGQVAADRYPYFTRIPLTSGYYCAGSLIAPDLVLTTPFCT